jgi:O-methyltransferase
MMTSQTLTPSDSEPQSETPLIQLVKQKDLYLELLKKSVMDLIYFQPDQPHTYEDRINGLVWPVNAHTMIGLPRLNNVQYCVEKVLMESVPGDLVETGVWRGGAVIFMRGILKAYGVIDRNVWVVDSFEGLPPTKDSVYTIDHELHSFSEFEELKVSLETVESNFSKYDLLDQQVQFLKGWFKDTLPTAPINKIAVLRLDGDLYESTMDVLVSLYPKVSPYGYVIVDDYHAIGACKQAIHDYRKRHNIEDPIQEIDGVGVFWQKTPVL